MTEGSSPLLRRYDLAFLGNAAKYVFDLSIANFMCYNALMRTMGLFRITVFISVLGLAFIAVRPAEGQRAKLVIPASRAVEAFDNPGMYPPQDLYKMARDALQAGQVDDARLFAMRVFFDGHRTSNLLDLMGAIEAKAGHPLFAGEWLRKSLCLNFQGQFARKLLAQLPPKPRPIPIDPTQIQQHFSQITSRLPQLLGRLNNQKLHFDSVLNEISRGQLYKALALAEEFEKRFPGVSGVGLTALCAMYLGRGKDALSLVEQSLKKAPHQPLLLFIKAMMDDNNPETTSTSRPQALFDLDKWGEARTAATQYCQLFPRSIEGYLVKARIDLETQKIDDAKTELQAAALIDPGHPVLSVLMADAFSASGQFSQAGEVLQKAFQQGYNLPSVNLKAGILAVSNGRLSEGQTILDDARTGMPFLDRDAYPMFVQLALFLDMPEDARTALDQWEKRSPRNSLECYLEGLYWLKVGQPKTALDYVRKGFAANPDRLPMLKMIGMLSAVSEDADLAAKINARLSGESVPAPSASVQPDRKMPSPAAVQPQPTEIPRASLVPEPQNQPAPASSASLPTSASVSVSASPSASPSASASAPASSSAPAPASSSASSASSASAAPAARISAGKFSISAGADVDSSYAESLRQNLDLTLAKIEPMLGELKDPIEVSLITAAGMGSRVAMYDFENETLTVTTLFFDPGTIKVLLQGEKPNLTEEEANQISQWLPYHTLACELGNAILMKRIKNAREKLPNTWWMEKGLAEVVGGSEDVLKELLVSAQRRIASDEAKLVTVEELNKIFSEKSPSAPQLEAARAQAYLMVAFLVKKGSDMKDGVVKFVKLLEAVCEGKEFDSAIKEHFGMPKSQFDSAWKEAAYWSLRQGMPYEW